MIRTHKFSKSLSGVVFLFVLFESVAAQSSNLQTFAENEQSDALSQNSVPKKVNERESEQDETIETYKLAIAVTPRNALLHNNLGVQYALVYRYEEAYKALKKSNRTQSEFRRYVLQFK